jgi:hypothetical protein
VLLKSVSMTGLEATPVAPELVPLLALAAVIEGAEDRATHWLNRPQCWPDAATLEASAMYPVALRSDTFAPFIQARRHQQHIVERAAPASPLSLRPRS